ncbi:hypothetical protein SRHO_G00139370 [Serrasalmus rhombeus]
MLLLENQVSVSVFRSVADPPDEPSRAAAAVSPQVQLALTAVYTALYSLLFFFVYSQLWLILHYGHKRLSYRSVFLFLCLLWSALRTTLFSFYFRNVPQASQLQPLPFWLLYCFPVCLQFCTLCLLNLYFAQGQFSILDDQRRPNNELNPAATPVRASSAVWNPEPSGTELLSFSDAKKTNE